MSCKGPSFPAPEETAVRKFYARSGRATQGSGEHSSGSTRFSRGLHGLQIHRSPATSTGLPEGLAHVDGAARPEGCALDRGSASRAPSSWLGGSDPSARTTRHQGTPPPCEAITLPTRRAPYRPNGLGDGAVRRPPGPRGSTRRSPRTSSSVLRVLHQKRKLPAAGESRRRVVGAPPPFLVPRVREIRVDASVPLTRRRPAIPEWA